MKFITQEAIEKIRAEAPKFIEAVDDSKDKDRVLIMTLDAFANEPELLHACLWYAYSNGVAVNMAPPTPEQSKNISQSQ